jgi:hypothetical protein
MALKCINCGHPVAGNTQICRHCGMEKAGEIAAWSRIYTFLGGVAASLAIYFVPLFVILMYYPAAVLSFLPNIKRLPDDAKMDHYIQLAVELLFNANAYLVSAAIWVGLIIIVGGIWKSIVRRSKR